MHELRPAAAPPPSGIMLLRPKHSHHSQGGASARQTVAHLAAKLHQTPTQTKFAGRRTRSPLRCHPHPRPFGQAPCPALQPAPAQSGAHQTRLRNPRPCPARVAALRLCAGGVLHEGLLQAGPVVILWFCSCLGGGEVGEDAGMFMQAPLRQRTCLERDAGMAGDMLQVASLCFRLGLDHIT